MSSSPVNFPVLFTVESSNRHEIILVNTGLDLLQLRQAVEAVAESPNCAEVLSKYRNKDSKDSVSEIRVKWAERHLFPKESLITDDNITPVLMMLASGGGKDVLNVKIVQIAGEAPKK